MNTSIRYYVGGGGDEEESLSSGIRNVRINAKQKLQFTKNDSSSNNNPLLLQLNGELDTGTGAPTFLSALVRHFYPNASLGAGLHYEKNEKLRCTLRGKKVYPVASNKFVNFVLKGRCDIDQELNQPKPQGALELVWNILDFQKEQDVRLKVGYELVDKIPYVQLRENNWTFNADISGRWNVRYNL